MDKGGFDPISMLNALLVRIGVSQFGKDFQEGGLFLPGKDGGLGPSSQSLLGRPRARPGPNDLVDLPPDEAGDPRRRRRLPTPEKERTRTPSESSSESEADVPKKKKPEPSSSFSLLNGKKKRMIELQYPLYIHQDPVDGFLYISMESLPGLYQVCVPFLLFLNTVQTPPFYLSGTSQEFRMLSRCYRHCKINNIYVDYNYNANPAYLSTFMLTVPTISISVTAARPLMYNTTEIEWSTDNYLNDSNTYYQPINTDRKSTVKSITVPSTNIDTTGGPVNGWIECATIHNNTLCLNIGARFPPTFLSTVGFPVDGVHLGTISIFLDMDFTTQQTSLGF